MGSIPLPYDWARGGVFFINLGVSLLLLHGRHESRNEAALLLILGTRGRLKGGRSNGVKAGPQTESVGRIPVERVWVDEGLG